MDRDGTESTASDPAGLRPVFFIGAGLLIVALLAAISMPRRPGPPPREIADDPLLVKGRELYMARCISCHGERGRGDGPIAGSIGPVKPGDLSDDRWKYGDRPEQVVGVISRGVPGTDMAAWAGTFSDDEIRAAAAYIYHLAGRDVPTGLRE